jgi:hypothetical protein
MFINKETNTANSYIKCQNINSKEVLQRGVNGIQNGNKSEGCKEVCKPRR